MKSLAYGVGILLGSEEIPTRSGCFFHESERERGGNRRVLRALVVALRDAAATRRFWFLNQTVHVVYFLEACDAAGNLDTIPL